MIEKVRVPCGESGEWRIERKYVKPSPFDFSGRPVPEGEYTGLFRGGTIVMSDTPSEMHDHSYFVNIAKGDCLVAGLGIGMVLNALCKKSEVNSVTVVELSKDVINLCGGYYLSMFQNKLEIVNCSIFDYKPSRKFDFAWFDIWDTICADNLDEMKKLHRKFARSAVWKGSWARELCERQERQWKRNMW